MIYFIMYLVLLTVVLVFNYCASVINERCDKAEQDFYDNQTSTPS